MAVFSHSKVEWHWKLSQSFVVAPVPNICLDLTGCWRNVIWLAISTKSPKNFIDMLSVLLCQLLGASVFTVWTILWLDFPRSQFFSSTCSVSFAIVSSFCSYILCPLRLIPLSFSWARWAFRISGVVQVFRCRCWGRECCHRGMNEAIVGCWAATARASWWYRFSSAYCGTDT